MTRGDLDVTMFHNIMVKLGDLREITMEVERCFRRGLMETGLRLKQSPVVLSVMS